MNRLIIYDSLSENMFLVFIFTQGAALGYVIVPFQGTKIHDYFHYPVPRRREEARGEVCCALHTMAIILPLTNRLPVSPDICYLSLRSTRRREDKYVFICKSVKFPGGESEISPGQRPG